MTRRQDSRTARLRQFFADNLDEELSAQDAAIKFDLSLDAVRQELYSLQSKGLVRRVNVWRGMAPRVERKA